MVASDFLLILALIAAVGAAGFYAGWRSAASHLNAARAVSDIANAAIAQANEYSTTMDNQQTAMQSLTNAVNLNTKTNEERGRAVEDALQGLFQGLERAGLARAPRATARQVGDPPDS